MLRLLLSFALAFAMTMATTASACTIPVFRYALERWIPSSYEIVVFQHNGVSRAQQGVLDGAQKGLGNAEIRAVDLAGDVAEEDQELLKERERELGKTAELPFVVVRFPNSDAKSPVVWAGALSADGLAAALDSPGRRELARRLMGGESCVWVVLESGDKASDDRLAATVAREIARQEKLIALPEIAADGPQLKSSLPLKLKFSMMRLSRKDPREAILAWMLRVAEPQYAESEEALVIPVIGRGRAISALPGSRADAERIGAFAEFICGQCSCEVKDQNPGIDLLMGANWDLIFDGGEAPESVPQTGGKSVPIPSSRGARSGTMPVAVGSDGFVNAHTEWRVQEPQPRSARQQWLWAGITAAGIAALVSGMMMLRRKGRR